MGTKKKIVDWQAIQRTRARKAKVVARTSKPSHPPIYSKARIMKAIKGSLGNKTEIARRVGCTWGVIQQALGRESWGDVREAYQNEVEGMGDIAEQAIRDAIEQRLDISTASRTAQWLLSRARYKTRDLGETTKIVLEGGDKPLHVVSDQIPLDTLGLPLELRRQVLEAIEANEQENGQ
jgi:hypothetical protein